MAGDQGIRVDEFTRTRGACCVVHSLVATIPPGGSTGWHRHHAWQTGIVARGRLRHRTADAERFHGPGDVLVERPGVDHEASNVSDEELVLVFVAARPEGVPLSTAAARGPAKLT
ncbi:cupin domain-containing protein [Curtobacterium sp. MCSS17_007]|uniref:cupin domain-containing protein n=1 Tax=Curtobacterium sp. MCSS17_007 TaxID=2175646 RepID=UPI000DAA57E6|nr:cupin domain-containing protein [Curtobacterium sp. MCSS17_007]WIE77145.1 cupin domain-containing protein [Curtobacterium sp. MCSS17_007]